ncbi:hypothetical protein PV08_02817 [Exophiala spinifera]|uniref:Uncharacterized protein n=1 Tax=Exophiala spinifera TaxID=91928 RepID=A0A0D2C4N3_9EURO|nr:uncharacterized protein PV08_02817 [Exophiala spinifera]KIW18529.1 hypothetical protein PV08_02817 [Exophiala spinifera]
MDFAPYQDASPEIERALSPPPAKGRPSLDSQRVRTPPPQSRPSQPYSRKTSEVAAPQPQRAFGNNAFAASQQERGQSLEAFETSLPIRLDYEACLAYLLLPPAGGVFLLIFEHKSDYVRFHAWQSSMLFTVIFILHLILAWSSVLSWMLFTVDLLLMGFLAMRAYRDVDTLEHYEVPFFGHLANAFVDDE